MTRSNVVYATSEGAGERGALVRLSARSDGKGLRQLGWQLGALAATGVLAWSARGSLWLLPAMVGHGVLLVSLFAPLHESIHWTAFRTRRLSDIVAWGCGAALVLPPAYFRAFHFAHHRHTQDPARDPELAVPKPRTTGAYLWHVSGLPYWREQLVTTVRHARGRVAEPFIAPRQRLAIVREARLLLGVYLLAALASIALASPALLYLWVGPALLGQPFLRLYLLAEHTGCPLVSNMLENSRTTRSLAPIRRLAWNMPYHAEHHAYPALPFHALPAAHRLLKSRIAVQASGYVAVHREIVAGLQAPGRAAGPDEISRSARRS
ncbi:MAG: fatty acid desaturase [Geminicoccaceae bacterium]